jgi:heptosyltransferase-2
LLQLLRLRHPGVEIDVLAPNWSAALLARMPEVTDAIVMPLGHGVLGLAERFRLGKQLRAKKYCQAIVLPNSFKSALIPFWAKIPLRTGFRGEWRYGVLNDMRQLDKKRLPLMVERFLALGVPADAEIPRPYSLPRLTVRADACQTTMKKYALTVERPVLALCPGAEFGPAKRWPEKYYAAVAQEKMAAGWQVWLLGSVNDRAVTATIAKLAPGCIDLAGKTSLGDAIDLLALATAVVTNDSGLMHIAAALQKPLVAVYGPTSAGFTPPLSTTAKVVSLSLVCQPCFQRTCPLKHHKCMEDLSPATVLNALQALLP